MGLSRRFFPQDAPAASLRARGVFVCCLFAWLGGSGPAAPATTAEDFRQLLSQGRCEEAQKLLSDSVSATEQSDAGLRHDLAVCLARHGNVRAAESVLDEILTHHPDHSESLYLKSYLLFSTGRYAEALQVASRYAAGTPGSGRAFKVSGLSRYMLGDAAGAQRDLEQATKLLPNDFEAIYYLGRIYFSRSMASAAVEAFRQALLLDPRSVKAFNQLGQAYEGLADFATAQEIYQRAIALEKQQPDIRSEWPYYNLGVLLLSEGKTAEAVSLLREALDRNPASVQTQVKLGVALASANQQEDALQMLHQAVEAAPEDSDARFQLGRLLVKLGRNEEARPHLDAFERLRQK